MDYSKLSWAELSDLFSEVVNEIFEYNLVCNEHEDILAECRMRMRVLGKWMEESADRIQTAR